MSCGGYKEITVLNETIVIDEELYETKTFTAGETITGQVLPIGGQIAEKEYGVTDRDCKEEIHIFMPTTIKKNDKLSIEGKLYEVRGLLPFPAHKQVLIKPFKGEIEVV
jgi:hypothetical protein